MSPRVGMRGGCKGEGDGGGCKGRAFEGGKIFERGTRHSHRQEKGPRPPFARPAHKK